MGGRGGGGAGGEVILARCKPNNLRRLRERVRVAGAVSKCFPSDSRLAHQCGLLHHSTLAWSRGDFMMDCLVRDIYLPVPREVNPGALCILEDGVRHYGCMWTKIARRQVQ